MEKIVLKINDPKLITKEHDSFTTGAVRSAILATTEFLIIGDASHSTKAVAKLNGTHCRP